MKEIQIGLLGCGTVGSGVAKMLIESREIIQSRLGASLRLKYVADIDTVTDRGVRFDDGVFISDARKVVDDPEIDIVVEMIGGEGIASEMILRAIDNGKQVVTANKALLAHDGNRIFSAAAAKGIDLAFEASVGGCMPVIKTLRETLVGNRILAMTGILNGTCNYILSKISEEKIPFAEALAQAQASGFAEADPTLDVEGFDTAHKLAIITALAFGMQIRYDDIYIEGISNVTPLDIEAAAQFGYRIKLLAICKQVGDAVEARVHPTMIPEDNILSSVSGALNALAIRGDAVEDILLYGRGAGKMPTASAVISDLVDIARNLMCGSSGRVPLLAYQADRIRSIPILPIDRIQTHYYFRFQALDQPGVLSKISGILGNHAISLKSVHQKGRKSGGSVPLIMLTHQTREAQVQEAMAEMMSLNVVTDRPVLIRIEDENGNE
jgi:homoserine dehydrogenase